MKHINKIRRLVDEERGTIKKSFGGRISFALAYPNLYRVGMSNLGFQNIYYLLNRENDVVCERAFLPEREDIDSLMKSKSPLVSLEGQTPLSNFNILAFSVSFERDYINVLKILDLARIPLLAHQRKDSYPLVIVGGICAFYNPEPLTDFIDLFVIGEGEEVLRDFLGEFKKTADSEETKEEMLKRLSQIDGIYVPSGYSVTYLPDGRIKAVRAKEGFPREIKKRYIKDVNQFPTSTRISTPHTEFSDMYLVEIERGCGRSCNFCVTGYSYNPPRYYSKETIMQEVKKGLKVCDRIGLVGSAVMDHPQLESICNDIIKMGGKISVASLRIDELSEGLVRCLAASGHKTLAFAPEAGTERLRRLISKEMTEEEIIGGIRLVMANNIPNIRLYFLIGIPTETDNDIEGIIDLIKKIKHHILKSSRKKGKLGNITLSINPLVPKPFTPFQWDRMDDVKSLERKLKMIKGGLKKVGNVSIIHELPKWSFVQAVLSRGDRRVGELLAAAYCLNEDWRKAFKEININPDFYAYRKRDDKETFPWDHINVGIKKEHLLKRREKGRGHG